MNLRSRTGAAVCSLALCLPLALAAGGPRDRATGGGQILVSADGGAGSTIAFTAQGDTENAKGQIQHIDRTAGTGQDQVRAHYVVDCVDVEGNTARIRGVERDTGELVGLFVVDNGEGVAADMDVVTITGANGDGPCNVAEPDEKTGLARGNAQTYDADA